MVMYTNVLGLTFDVEPTPDNLYLMNFHDKFRPHFYQTVDRLLGEALGVVRTFTTLEPAVGNYSPKTVANHTLPDALKDKFAPNLFVLLPGDSDEQKMQKTIEGAKFFVDRYLKPMMDILLSEHMQGKVERSYCAVWPYPKLSCQEGGEFRMQFDCVYSCYCK